MQLKILQKMKEKNIYFQTCEFEISLIFECEIFVSLLNSYHTNINDVFGFQFDCKTAIPATTSSSKPWERGFLNDLHILISIIIGMNEILNFCANFASSVLKIKFEQTRFSSKVSTSLNPV